MTNKPFFPWLKNKWSRSGARRPLVLSAPASSLHREIVQRQLRERMAKVERRMTTCPIAPVQQQMQTVWFHLVHEYLKNKRKAVNDDNCDN